MSMSCHSTASRSSLPFFALLTIAYLTHHNTINLPAIHGLILFSLGISDSGVGVYFRDREGRRPEWTRRNLVSIVFALAELNGPRRRSPGASVSAEIVYAAQATHRPFMFCMRISMLHRYAKIFCDEGTVRALSGIPEDSISNVPPTPRMTQKPL
jgi:hypothetical protein